MEHIPGRLFIPQGNEMEERHIASSMMASSRVSGFFLCVCVWLFVCNPCWRWRQYLLLRVFLSSVVSYCSSYAYTTDTCKYYRILVPLGKTWYPLNVLYFPWLCAADQSAQRLLSCLLVMQSDEKKKKLYVPRMRLYTIQWSKSNKFTE
jgi:hypothetical protein